MKVFIEKEISDINIYIKNNFSPKPNPGQVQEYQYYMGKLAAFKQILEKVIQLDCVEIKK